MGNTSNSKAGHISQPQGSMIVSVQHKEYEDLEDCDEIRALRQLHKAVPLRTAISSQLQSSSKTHARNPAQHLRVRSHSHSHSRSPSHSQRQTVHAQSMSDTQRRSSQSKSQSNASNASSASMDAVMPFNPGTMLRPPSLSAHGMDTLYKHLRDHFTALAIKVDCNQVTCFYQTQEMDEQLAYARAATIDMDYTSNQLAKAIASTHALSAATQRMQQQCDKLVAACDELHTLLPDTWTATPRCLPSFSRHALMHTHTNALIVMQGAMVRIGSYLKGSKQRWVTLFSDGLMAYYSAQRTELKGVIDLMHATEVIPSDLSQLMVSVRHSRTGRVNSWHFKCPSPEHVTKWLDAIRSLQCIRARSQRNGMETISAQWMQTHSLRILEHKISDDAHCVFRVLHIFGDDNKCCYQVRIYSDGAQLRFEIQRRTTIIPACVNGHHSSSQLHWTQVKSAFDAHDDDNDEKYECNLSYRCENDIIAMQICTCHSEESGPDLPSQSQLLLLFATRQCLSFIQLKHIMDALHSDQNINADHVQTLIDCAAETANNPMHARGGIQHISDISDFTVWQHSRGMDLVFICDCQQHCVWCTTLSPTQKPSTFAPLIKLFHTPSPNSICVQNETLYTTSLQCGIYFLDVKDVAFSKLFADKDDDATTCLWSSQPSLATKPLSLLENVALKAMVSMALPPAPSSSDLDTGPPRSGLLWVLDIENQLYMVRLTDLAIIAFGAIENAYKLFYYEVMDQLYITKTRPKDNCVDCISHAYHEIMSLQKQNAESEPKTASVTEKKKTVITLVSSKNQAICFPKSLFLVYRKSAANLNDNGSVANAELEVLIEVDNMLQGYMLSELRKYSRKLLKHALRNYSFLYLYTSPYDGQSMYRELDIEYENAVPAKNLIQHSSVGPVILVKLRKTKNNNKM